METHTRAFDETTGEGVGSGEAEI
eukprot:COSAG02_NODE_51364_length_314_cov_1.195349_1_plen_23_part_10